MNSREDKGKRKRQAEVPLAEKQTQGKTLDLAYRAPTASKSATSTSSASSSSPSSSSSLITTFPQDLRELPELRKVDLSNQVRFDTRELNKLRYAGQTLTWINLSGMAQLGGQMDSSSWMWLKMCSTLFVLNVSRCHLRALPSELAGLTTLKALVASHNSLESTSLVNVSKLSNLNTLILSDNALTSIPSSLTGNLKELKKLNLANNKLSSDGLPSFANMASLEELRLNGNVDINKVPSGLADLAKLSILELSHTGLASMDELESLKACQTLVNLGIRGTPIGSEDAEQREKVTSLLPRLRILDNVRFDRKFVERKQRAQRAQQGEDAVETKGEEEARIPIPKRHFAPEDGEDPVMVTGKRKRHDEDHLRGTDSRGQGKEKVKPKTSLRSERNHDRPVYESLTKSRADGNAGEGDEGTSEGPKRKRVRKKKGKDGSENDGATNESGKPAAIRSEQRVAEEKDAPSNGIVESPSMSSSSSKKTKKTAKKKPAKSVGGSLSEPQESHANKAEQKPKDSVQHKSAEELAAELAKAKTSVVAVIDAASSGVEKRRKDRKSRAALSVAGSAAQGNSSGSKKDEDVLAMLLGSKVTAGPALAGW